MDGRGGCCIARYPNGGVYGYDMSKVNRIMLRFRPIAPKPVAGGGEISSGGGAKIGKTAKVAGGRRKRRSQSNNNTSKRCNNKKREDCSRSPDHDHSDRTAVTLLPLLTESPEPKVCSQGIKPSLTWLSFDQEKNNNNNNDISDRRRSLSDRTVGVVPPKPVGSSVTVECVTDTWTDGNGLGRTDEERRANLERDTCPGFISDGFGRVTWTNMAYTKMVGGGGDGGGDVMVWLVMKERLPVVVMLTYPAFTCRVRLQCHVDGVDASKSSVNKTMPCDVWRLDGGGFAWRLDVKAALCLGR